MEAVKFRKYFGEALTQRREAANLSRQAIADVLDVDRSTVFRWETGDKWPTDPDVVVSVYEREASGPSPIDLWGDALARAQEADAAGELERFLTEDRPSAGDLDAVDARQAEAGLPPADGAPPSD